MNQAQKLRWANILTALVTIVAVIQTFILKSPFDPNTIVITGAILMFLGTAGTAWKQYLAPEVDTSVAKVTFWVAVAVTVGALASVFNAFNLPDKEQQFIQWIITVLVAVFNILSKQIFPSLFQQGKIDELKTKK